MKRAEGKVAFITGAARGQGRAHALRLAGEGADIIAVDLCESVGTTPYDGATDADLAETGKRVEELGGRVLARQADVRDLGALERVVEEGLSRFGGIDVVCANAGIASFGSALELTEQMWHDVLDINLTGVWKTVRATAPSMVERGRGGSIILTSLIAGLIGFPNLAHYTAAKHGVTGLMRVLAIELAPHHIRVNSVHPATVDTPMVVNEASWKLFLGGIDGATREQAAVGMKALNALPIPWLDVADISNAVLYLASDKSRHVTGTTMVGRGAVSHGATAVNARRAYTSSATPSSGVILGERNSLSASLRARCMLASARAGLRRPKPQGAETATTGRASARSTRRSATEARDGCCSSIRPTMSGTSLSSSRSGS